MTDELLHALGDGGPVAQGIAVLVVLLTLPVLVLACRKSESAWTLPLSLVPTWAVLGLSVWGTGRGLDLLISAVATYARATHGTVVRAALDTLFGIGMMTGAGLTVFGCVGALGSGLGALLRRETWSPAHAIAPVALAGVAASAFPQRTLVVVLCATAAASWLFAAAVIQRQGTTAARLAVGAHCLIGTLGVALYHSTAHTRSVVQQTVMAAPSERSQVLLEGLADASSLTAWAAVGVVIVATASAVAPTLRRTKTASISGWVLFAVTLVFGVASLSWQSNTTRRATTELLSLDQRAATAELAVNLVYLPRVSSAPPAATGPTIMVSRNVITLDRRYLGPLSAQTAAALEDQLPDGPTPQLSADRDLSWATLRPVLQALHDAGHSRILARVECADHSVGNIVVNVSETGFRPPEDFRWFELINRAVGTTSWAVSLYEGPAALPVDDEPSDDVQPSVGGEEPTE